MYKCEICGKEFEKRSYSGDYQNLCGNHQCFTKKYWKDIIKEKEYHPIIKGVCYCLDINHPIVEDRGQHLGYGGRIFKIRYFNGKIIKTNNLWYNDVVPEWCRNDLPDNAEFMSNDSEKKSFKDFLKNT